MKKLLSILVLLSCLTTASAQGYDSLNVSLLYHWSDSSIPPAVIHGNAYNEIWGYAANGMEYAILGTSLGTHFFDVSDPVNSTQVAFIPGQVSSSQIIHRDMKTYQHYLYIVADEGPSTMQVVDLQYLPDSVVTVYDNNSLLARAHNVFIDTLHARLYTCGGSSEFSVYDISTPVSPVLLLDCDNDIPWWNGSVDYVHDAYVRDHVAYLNAQDEFYVIDFTDLNNVSILGSLDNYPDQGYNHSGWLNDAGTHYSMCDETHGMRVKLLDVTDLNDIQVESMFESAVHPNSIVHNVIYTGDILHASYYHDGYYVWDLSDKVNPTLLGYYDTSDETHLINYKGSWGVYPLLPSGIVLVSDMQEGLFILDVSQAVSISEAQMQEQVLKLWPNPGTDVVNLLVSGARTNTLQVRVYDSTGALAHNESMNHAALSGGQISVKHLHSGLYFLQVSDGKSNWNSTFVKE